MDFLFGKEYLNEIIWLQRKTAFRIIGAYRTTSTRLVLTPAQIPQINILVMKLEDELALDKQRAERG